MAIPFSYTCASALGLRSYQEDRYTLNVVREGLLVGVFDGHGGAECSEYLFQTFYSHTYDEINTVYREFENDLKHDADKESSAIKGALARAFVSADEMTCSMHSGSTASVVFIPKDAKVAYIAILGDSPVIANLPAPAMPGLWHLSPEHNVRTNDVEREQAIQRGGFYQDGYMWNTPNTWSDHARGLQMGRSFGDSDLGFLSREPEIYSVPLGKWLLVCTDGAVDPGHGDSAGPIAQIAKLIEDGADAQAIVDRALAARTGDNVTAVLWRAE